MSRMVIEELRDSAAFTELQRGSSVPALRIYRRNGVEAFTDLATLDEVRKNADLSKEVMSNIQRMQRKPATTLGGELFQRALSTAAMQEAPPAC